MSRPTLLDLFCGQGGAAMGYHRAGFDIVGVDINPQPRYPFTFVQGDAMALTWGGFDAVHASPPCQAHSALASFRLGHDTGWMLPATIERLTATGVPWVVENVEAADMPDSIVLCGSSFGLRADGHTLRRHRRFQSNVWLWSLPCDGHANVIGVYGHGGGKRARGGQTARAGLAARIMGIDWMSRDGLSQAIPPAYTQFIGAQLIEALA